MACRWRRVESLRAIDAPHSQVLMVPFTYHFPASVFCYWVSANAFSLGQTVLLNKVPGVREALGVPVVQTTSKVRKPTAPPVETVFGRLEKAIDTAKAFQDSILQLGGALRAELGQCTASLLRIHLLNEHNGLVVS